MVARTFNFTVQTAGDWPAQWLAANPVGSGLWTGRWTTNAVNMDAAGASGLYEFWADEDARLSRIFEDEPGGQCLDWDNGFLYDPVTGWHTVGGGVGSSSAYGRAGALRTWYFRYDPRTNRFAKRNNPVGQGTGHHYSENAMDRVGRKYYRRLWQFDLDDWTAPAVSIPPPVGFDGGGSAQAKVFHEHLGRLYAIQDSNKHWYWTPTERNGSTGTWSALQDHGYDLGLHPISAYHIGLQTAVFGGGNSPSTAFFKIGPTGERTRLDDPPSALLPIQGTKSMLVDCGLADAFLLLFDVDDTPPSAPFNTIWLLKPNAAPGSQWVQSVDALPSYLTAWSGFRVSNAVGLPHLGMVMYLRYYQSGNDTNADLKQRRCSVYFYKPSGA
jgi:hypothetical protein